MFRPIIIFLLLMMFWFMFSTILGDVLCEFLKQQKHIVGITIIYSQLCVALWWSIKFIWPFNNNHAMKNNNEMVS